MFALAARSIAFVRALPRGVVEFRLGGQLIDSGSSVPAQYRAACRAQSTRDFIAKIKKLEEEADESALWLALLRAAGLPDRLKSESEALEDEFSQITAIAVASAKTARARLLREKDAKRRAKQTPSTLQSS
ncbi:MAG: four helix bundle protein [Vicinamibacteria bacterium]|nr:four helix bundle protein [Vicinamibacteria bacterium]